MEKQVLTHAKKEIVSLADLRPDPKNARRHTPRNIGVIVDAMQKVGAARSIVIDEDNVILAGNATVDAAGEAGIEKVRVVEADGNTLIAVRRTGLSKKQKAALAIADNRAADLAEWDPVNLTELAADVELDLAEVGFTEEEVAELGVIEPATGEWPEIGETSTHTLIVRYSDAEADTIRKFLGDDRMDLTDGRSGKKLLERIKTIAST